MLSRLRRFSVASILIVAALLEVGTVVYAQVSALISPALTVKTGEQLVWAAIDLALLWAIWRRSAAARYALIVLIALPAIMMVLSLPSFDWFPLGLLLLATVELILLFAPQVRSHAGVGKARLSAEANH